MNSDMALFAEKLGIKKVYQRGDELGGLCPFHDDKHVGNFFFSLSKGVFYCFSCGARGFLPSLGYKNCVTYEEIVDEWNKIKLSCSELEIPSQAIEQDLVNHYKYDCGFSTYSLKRVGWDDESTRLLLEYNVYSDEYDRPLFLLADKEKLYRAAYIRTNSSYLLLFPNDAKRNGCLFGEHLPATDYTVIVEGPFDALAVRKYTGQRAVALMGTLVTEKQLLKLASMGKLILMLDGDVAGKTNRSKLFHQLIKKNSDIWVAGGYNCDPDELKDKIQEIINNSKSGVEFLLWENKHVRR